MRVVVFGAGGFVGGWICEELSLRDDIEQIACVRKWASSVRLARRGIELRQADLENTQDYQILLTGADAVINAAMLPAQREPELVATLYSACVLAGVRRFVQMSSAALYGNRIGSVDESMAPAPVDAYGRGKAEMERRLVELSKGSDTQVVILRPSIIYGPFSEGWTVRYVERISKGRWKGLGRAGDGTCNLVHAQDVARAAIAAVTNDIAPGVQILNVNGPDHVTWNEYIERLGDELAIPNRARQNVVRFRIMAAAAAMLRIGAKLSSVRSFYRRSKGATRHAMTGAKAVTALYPAASELDLLSRKVFYLADRAAKTLRTSSSIPLDQGLRQSVAWCRLHGIV
jgi:nucleoside-diphosphate-sugar epimerase